MKKLAMVVGLSACLLSLLLVASVTQAKDLDRQAELLASCQKIQQYLNLTLSPETSAEQRALVALNIAIMQSQPLDESIGLAEVLRQASSFTTYLMQSDTFYLWSIDHWEGNGRSTYTYSGNRMTSEVEQYWDSDSAKWLNASQTLNTYNVDGTQNTATQQEWQTDQWVNSSLTSFTYSGGTTTMLMQTWSGSAWVDYFRYTFTYSGGNLATTVAEMYVSSAWVNSVKNTYTYSGGHLTESIRQSWVSSAWVNAARSTYTYNGSGMVTQIVAYMWQAAAWVSTSKYDYSYDGSGHEILDVYSTWGMVTWMAMEADTFKWSGGRDTEIVYNKLIPPSVNRTQYTYDDNGNKTVDLGQEWSGSEWVNSDKGVFVYREGACGDCDGSGDVNIVDVVYLVAYIFSGGAAPKPLAAGDVDCSEGINIVDVVYLINFVFRGGPAPCEACQ